MLADVNTQVEAGTKLIRIEEDPGQQADDGHGSDARVDLSALAN